MKINKLKNFTLVNIATAVMLGCGGGGGPGDGDNGATGLTTVGAITGFGSVYVNGVEYETNQSEYEVEDEAAFDDSALKVGMVVKVKGSVNPDGRTGTANQVIYEDEIQGPVQGLIENINTKTFNIFGVPVAVSSTDTFFDNGLTYVGLQNGNNVEVSGHFNSQVLQATYIKLENDNDAEIKGVVSNSNGTDEFTLTSFFGAVITVTLDLTAIPTPILPQDGQYVEVEGTPTGGNTLEAFRVELEDRHHLDDDEGEIEIRGLLTKTAGGDWFLNDIPLDTSGNIRYEPPELEDTINNNLPPEGMMVKVKGDYLNGDLVVDKIEDKQDSLEFKGDVAAVSASGAKTGTVTISFGNATGTVTVNLDNNTIYPDDDSVQQFDLRNVRQNDYVEVKAMQNQSGQILGTRFDVDNTVGEYEVEGPLDDFSDGVSITAMNVTFSVDSGTSYPLGKPQPSDIVDITDQDRDGIADIVEIDD